MENLATRSLWPWGCSVKHGGGLLKYLNGARWLGWLQGKVKSPSSSASGGDSPGEHGPPIPISSASSGLTPSSVEDTPPVTQPNSQEKPQRPFTLKVCISAKQTSNEKKKERPRHKTILSVSPFARNRNESFYNTLLRFHEWLPILYPPYNYKRIIFTYADRFSRNITFFYLYIPIISRVLR